MVRPTRCAAAALALFAATACTDPPPSEAPTSPREAPATLRAEARTLPRTRSYVGTLVAPHDATLSTTSGGRVEAYTFEVGKRVRAGDVLIRLGATELAFASQAAAASATQAAARIAGVKEPAELPGVLAARASLDIAEDAARRAAQLHTQGSMSEQELTRLRTHATAARAEYDVALSGAKAEFGRLRELQAMAGQARAALHDREIRAPFDGLVLERFVDLGQMAAPGTPLLRLVDASEILVRFEVPQFDAHEVVLGRRATVRLQGAPLSAEVARLTPGLVGDASTRRVEARLLDPPDGALLLGARLTVWLDTAENEELVEVPLSAITRTAGLSRAWVLMEGRLEERLLSVARIEGDRVLVRSGIRGGEEVVKEPLADFKRGEEVAL
ncbi:efflux RND transporter periplasmic adaptor subunit [Chondromyces crocatus]|nr:efflux RND transporter periplasmic adaptor subunit [Chondromyces crocatus]